jgi:hypothetical protein
MVFETGDDPRAAGGALLVQVIDAGEAEVDSGGGVDARGRGPDKSQSHRIAPQQHQAHAWLVDLDLEPEHLAQERGSWRQVVNLQVGPAAQELGHGLPALAVIAAANSWCALVIRGSSSK